MELTLQIIATSEFLDLNLGNGFRVIGRYDNQVEALAAVVDSEPDVILLDYDLEKNNTELLIKSLLIESTESKIILLGKHLSDEIILNCLICGIYGCLESKDIRYFLNQAIVAVGQGQAWISRRHVGLLMEKFRG